MFFFFLRVGAALCEVFCAACMYVCFDKFLLPVVVVVCALFLVC